MPDTPEELDSAVRMAAFAFLEDRLLEGGEATLPYHVLRQGFVFRGRRVPLVGPQGIFKPAVLPEIPLTIMTAPRGSYDDGFDADGMLHYRYRGEDPMHHENVGLRKAMLRESPLIYFHGIVRGRYIPFWPVYVVGDDLPNLTFRVFLDERALLRESEPSLRGEAAERPRSYVTAMVKKRVHQTWFRERVLQAYQECCAICRLRHRVLLDATHILPDKHPQGEPIVPNGISLCKLHHAAYDRNILGIRPDLHIDVRMDILEEVDGPMLQHGLQGFQGERLLIPLHAEDHPNPDFLAERYELFLRAS
jgi:putative restriction endonuclease